MPNESGGLCACGSPKCILSKQAPARQEMIALDGAEKFMKGEMIIDEYRKIKEKTRFNYPEAMIVISQRENADAK